MKAVYKIFLMAILALVIQANPAIAQKGGHHLHGGGGGNKKMYVNKPYNKKVMVGNKPYNYQNKPYYYHSNYYHHPHYYHHYPRYYGYAYRPYWGPPAGYYRRWIFFPHYNFYWDNYNSMYVYWGGGGWIRAAALPPALININITNAKKYELKEDDDTVDDIYDSNDSHKKEYPEN